MIAVWVRESMGYITHTVVVLAHSAKVKSECLFPFLKFLLYTVVYEFSAITHDSKFSHGLYHSKLGGFGSRHELMHTFTH